MRFIVAAAAKERNDVTPGARVAATIEILDEIVSHAERPADLVSNAYFRARRFIGGGDRRALSERVWNILRRYGQLRWWLERAGAEHLSGRMIVAADAMLSEGQAMAGIEALFDGGRYRPAALDDAERRVLRQFEGHSLPHPEQPDWVRLNVQEWVAPHLKEAYGEAWGREIAALIEPPPVDLRVNLLKATPQQAAAATRAATAVRCVGARRGEVRVDMVVFRSKKKWAGLSVGAARRHQRRQFMVVWPA